MSGLDPEKTNRYLLPPTMREISIGATATNSVTLTSCDETFPRKIVAAVRYRLQIRISVIILVPLRANPTHPNLGSQATSKFRRSKSLCGSGMSVSPLILL